MNFTQLEYYDIYTALKVLSRVQKERISTIDYRETDTREEALMDYDRTSNLIKKIKKNLNY